MKLPDEHFCKRLVIGSLKLTSCVPQAMICVGAAHFEVRVEWLVDYTWQASLHRMGTDDQAESRQLVLLFC